MQGSLDFNHINQAAMGRLPDLLARWFPQGKLHGQEFKIGDVSGAPGDSLSINTITGVWCDFAADQSGSDPISLNAARQNLKQGESAKDLAQQLGLNGSACLPGPSTSKHVPQKAKQTWVPLPIVPDNAPEPPNDYSKNIDGKWVPMKFVARWAYLTADGKLIGYACRFEYPEDQGKQGKRKKRKEIVPQVWARNGAGVERWQWKSMPKPRPLYGLDLLAQNPGATVFVVSGEKTTNAARELLPIPVVVTWAGGDQATRTADWSPLRGRRVVLVPDADKSGIKAIQNVVQHLSGVAVSIKVVHPPAGLPEGWDLADAQVEGWPPEKARAWVIENMRAHAPVAESPVGPQLLQNLQQLPPDPHHQMDMRGNPDDYQGMSSQDGPPSDYCPEDYSTPEQEQPHFSCLGYNRDKFFFLARGKQVLEFSGRALRDKGTLFQLAPLHYWEREFPSKQGIDGKAVDMAANELIGRSYAVGVFRPDRLRGTGAWWDKCRSIFHAGDCLIVDGKETKTDQLDTKYIYEAAPPVAYSTSPLPKRDAHKLVELCDMLQWERTVNGRLLAGWCVIASIGGALKWRPHIWVTSGAGSGKSWVMEQIVRRCLGDLELPVLGATTEAGLRQTLGHDARPVVFDEAESENQRASATIDAVMQLMRQSSSESGGKIIKGTTTGTSMTFNVRSCFAFSSIGVNVS